RCWSLHRWHGISRSAAGSAPLGLCHSDRHHALSLPPPCQTAFPCRAGALLSGGSCWHRTAWPATKRRPRDTGQFSRLYARDARRGPARHYPASARCSSHAYAHACSLCTAPPARPDQPDHHRSAPAPRAYALRLYLGPPSPDALCPLGRQHAPPPAPAPSCSPPAPVGSCGQATRPSTTRCSSPCRRWSRGITPAPATAAFAVESTAYARASSRVYTSQARPKVDTVWFAPCPHSHTLPPPKHR